MAGVMVFPHADVMLNAMSGPRILSLTPCAIGADKGSVYVAIPTPQGQWVLTTVDLALFLTAADTFTATHGDPRKTSKKAG